MHLEELMRTYIFRFFISLVMQLRETHRITTLAAAELTERVIVVGSRSALLVAVLVLGLTSQVAAQSCVSSISRTAMSFAAIGGTGSVNITASAGCNWQASSNETWVSVRSEE